MSLNNRILIASPCYGQVNPEILEDWMRFIYHCGRRMPEYEFFIGIKSKSEQFRARNAIVEGAQQNNCDRILMLDDDMIINHGQVGGLVPGDSVNVYDFLRRMIAHDKDICGALYYGRNGDCPPVLMTKLNENGYRFLRDDEITGGLQRVDVAGGGCLLIKTRVFDRIPFPYFAPEYEFGTDIQLCRKAAEKGFEIWADTGFELGHMRNEKAIVTSVNRHQYQDGSQTAMGRKVSFVAADLYSRLMTDAMEYTRFSSTDELIHNVDGFLKERKHATMPDADWYRLFPRERIARQAWFNTQISTKKMMTQWILGTIQHNRPLRILDFGCGIGVTALALAEKGHRVTAMDIRGTGPLEFLKWRAGKYGVPLKIVESEGGPPSLRDDYDVIIAMDSIEHIADWKETVKRLGEHLRTDGMLFANNAVLEDMKQPEHYEMKGRDFIAACMDARLMPHTQLSYIKREIPLEKENPVYA